MQESGRLVVLFIAAILVANAVVGVVITLLAGTGNPRYSLGLLA